MPSLLNLHSPQQAQGQDATPIEHLLSRSNPANANARGSAAVSDQLLTLLEPHLNEHSKWDVWADEEDEAMAEEAELQVHLSLS